MLTRAHLDNLAFLLLGIGLVWFIEPAPAPGLQGGVWALLACLLLALPLGRDQSLQWRSTALAFCLLMAVPVLDIALHRLPYSGQSLPYLACLLTVVLVLMRNDQPPIAMLARALAISGVVAALIGWYGLLVGNPVVGEKMYLLVTNGTVKGPLQQPNLFATQLLLAVVSLSYLQVMNLRRRLWLIGMLLIAPMAALSSSRAGLVNILILAVLSTWFWRKKIALARPMLWACVLMLVAQLVTKPLVSVLGLNAGSAIGRMVSGEYTIRLDLQKRAWDIFLSNPIGGVGFGGFGWGDFLLKAAEYKYSFFLPQFDHSHNVFTQLLAEAGLLGGGAALLLLVIYLRALIGVKNEQTAMAVLGLAVLWGHSQFEYPLWYMHFLAIFGLLYAQIDLGREFSSQLSFFARAGAVVLIMVGSVHFVSGIWRLDGAGELQANGRVNDAYLLAAEVAGRGGPIAPYAHHVMLEMARPGDSEQGNKEMTAIASKVVRWKPDSFVAYHYSRWLASVGARSEASRQLDLASHAYPEKLPIFVRDVFRAFPQDGYQLQSFANEVFRRCDKLCQEKAQVDFLHVAFEK